MTSPKRVIPEVNMIVSWSKGFLFIFWYHKFGEIFQKNRKTVEFLVEITHFPKRGKTQQKFVDKKITNFIIKNYRSYRWITRTLYKWPFVGGHFIIHVTICYKDKYYNICACNYLELNNGNYFKNYGIQFL
jgi:hypothetical protein